MHFFNEYFINKGIEKRILETFNEHQLRNEMALSDRCHIQANLFIGKPLVVSQHHEPIYLRPLSLQESKVGGDLLSPSSVYLYRFPAA